MASDLSELVNSLTDTAKIRIGYSVNSYESILEVAIQNIQSLSQSQNGDDYSAVRNLGFDDNDFSKDPQSALWKMKLGIFGSCPVRYEERYSIVKPDSNTEVSFNESGNSRQLPFSLDKNQFETDFVSGAYVDYQQLVKYLNQMYCTAATLPEHKFTEELLGKLVAKKCLIASVVLISTNETIDILLAGRLPIGSASSLLINPTILATNVGKRLNLPLTLATPWGNESLVPSSKYDCPIDNETYNQNTGEISKLTYKEFKSWCSQTPTSDYPCLSLNPIEPKEVHVRFCVNENKVQEARAIVGSSVSENFYKKYTINRHGSSNLPASLNANVRRMFECLEQACDRFGCRKFTQDDIKDVGSGGWVNFGGVVVSGASINTKRSASHAMESFFYIPCGWPMSVIHQNFSGRSAALQKRRGHKRQLATSDATPLPWIVCESVSGVVIPDEERMDSALNTLGSDVLSGNMDREWYQQRLEKADKGVIKILCQSEGGVDTKFNELFKRTWDVFAEAASIYNTGLDKEQQTSAGEMLLRCAPCLCAINGANSPIHRNRGESGTGHAVGAAIDFDPINNDATESLAQNRSTAIVRGMDKGYRPFLHYLYELGGIWGGSYRFDTNSSTRRFDAMHIQF